MKLDEKQRQAFENKMLRKGHAPGSLSIASGVSLPAIRRILNGGSVTHATFVRVAAHLEKLPDKVDPGLLEKGA